VPKKVNKNLDNTFAMGTPIAISTVLKNALNALALSMRRVRAV
tara:strand:- start:6939 stop:7067 length:129 start_codon:yes stop_codon:yes gene_type:complete